MRRLAQFLNEALAHCTIESDQAILKDIVHKQLERCPVFDARQVFVDELDMHVDNWVRSSDDMQQFLYATDINKLSPDCQGLVQKLVLGLGQAMSLLVKWQSRCNIQDATKMLNDSLKTMSEEAGASAGDFAQHQNQIVDLFTAWRKGICEQLGDQGLQVWKEIANHVAEIVKTLEQETVCNVSDTTLLKTILQTLLSRCPYQEIKDQFAHLK